MEQEETNDDLFSNKKDDQEDQQTAENARLLFQSLKQERLPADEKEQIWGRITENIEPAPSKESLPNRRIGWYWAAASVALLLLVGIGYRLSQNSSEEMMKLAATQATFGSSDVQLRLADKRTIDLKSKTSDVVYQNQHIRVDSVTLVKSTDPAQNFGLNTLVVPYGKRSTITLPDGSKIWLNSGSKLVYPTEFQSDKRTIDLKSKTSDVVYQNQHIRVDSVTLVKSTDPAQNFGLNTLVVPYGKRSTITLPDGSKIWLNSGSKLVYPTEFQSDKREVFLEGQAYFSVAHQPDKPFYVQTKTMNIKVLGTQFDVSAYADDSQSYAVLAKGSIELVTHKNALLGATKTRMVPGTRAAYDGTSKRPQLTQVDIQEFVSWKEGYLLLKQAPLTEILKKLSRYYKHELRVENEDVGRETFSGTLDLQEDLEQVIATIATTTSLNYQKGERRYTLEKITTKQ